MGHRSGQVGFALKMKRAFVLAFVTALVAFFFVVSSYNSDRAQLLEARRLAQLDLLEEVSHFPQNFAFVVPKRGKENCSRKTYLNYYVSQICYINGEIGATRRNIRLVVIYLQPISRFSQAVYQSNETYFEYTSESGEVAVRLYGDGTVERFGSVKK